MICLLQKGQRSKIEFGNNTQTEYFYEAKTFRLMQLLTTRNSNTQNPLQDLRYTYDPVGNIVEIYDASKETSYYKNSEIEPRHLFTYDALYRLLSGTGRELLGLAQATSGGYAANSAGAADAKALHSYTQNFAYDELGNIKSIQHETKTSTLNWTRNYVYDGATNRLLKHDENQTLPDYTYDEHGNMLTMPHLQSMHYDYQDQLNKVVLDASENTAYYIYDANGQRVRKVIEKTGGIKEERYYLGNYEVYRKFVGITLETERTTVAVADNKRKIATIDKLTVDKRSLINMPVAVIRYQYDNHLGSASLELDASAQIISYEEYHPFGTTSYRSGKSETEVSLKRYKYVGKEKDEETGLYYYGFRYYAPWIARFINVDPLQHEYPHYTPFQYAGNKPITYVDLDGLEEGSNPLDVMRIRQNRSSNLGPRSTKARESGFHAGHDLFAFPGEKVYAVKSGKIIALNNDLRTTAYGLSIVVEHNRTVFGGWAKDKETGDYNVPFYKTEKYYSFYAHLSKFNSELNVGDEIKAGHLIGYTGNTGNAYNMKGIEQHLHFEMGTKLRKGTGGFVYLDKKHLFDPNYGYLNIRFDSEDDNKFDGVTGIIKTEFDILGNDKRKTLQKFFNKYEYGEDVLIFPKGSLLPVPNNCEENNGFLLPQNQ